MQVYIKLLKLLRIINKLDFRLIVNETLRLEVPPPQIFNQTIMATQVAPISQYLLSVSADAKLTLTPITVAAVDIPQTRPASSSEILTPCITPIPNEQQQISR